MMLQFSFMTFIRFILIKIVFLEEFLIIGKKGERTEREASGDPFINTEIPRNYHIIISKTIEIRTSFLVPHEFPNLGFVTN